MPKAPRLLVLDIDNTLFDWVGYYAPALTSLLHYLERLLGVPYADLAEESRAVFRRHGSIEYPFVIQELPSVRRHYGDDVKRLLDEAVTPGRAAFMQVAQEKLRPFEGVVDTLADIALHPAGVQLVALTDAPQYVAMWKLKKLGLLSYFDAIYGLADPRLPTDHNQVMVSPDILLKFVQQERFGFRGRARILPDDYEKPGVRGLKTVLMDYELDEPPERRLELLWVGDNLRKDVGLGHRLGVPTAWARYGAGPRSEDLAALAQFSPPENIERNLNLVTGQGRPEIVLERFADLRTYFFEQSGK